jgi:uncharacterized membrane protein YozB (DUF420 family)
VIRPESLALQTEKTWNRQPETTNEKLKTMSYLPTLNACLNATSAILLLSGFYFIRQHNVRAHRACMASAFIVSILFLVSYLTYHYHAGATHFTGQESVRVVYFAILISHTILAALVPILAIVTLRRALQGQYPAHRRIARWTLPIWLYVSVTGVMVYLMLYHLYPPTYLLGADTP